MVEQVLQGVMALGAIALVVMLEYREVEVAKAILFEESVGSAAALV